MAGVLDTVRVLDLSWGVAGPMAAMLLADQGAQVTKIEPPGGDPFRRLSGYRVWNRGKRSAVLDFEDPADRERLMALAERADVLLESFAPGTLERLGLDYATLAARNPRLVFCSITAYGRGTADEQRPGYDALVAARTGLQWEQRGFNGGAINRICGVPDMLADLETPEGCAEGPTREGPLFSSSSWPSLAACFLATTGISAALRARELTGRGQRVETSLLQGVLATTIGGWQRCDNPAAEHYQTWVFDPRATKGEFRCGDGRWVHHWVPNPRFVLGVSEGDRLERRNRDVSAPRNDPNRILTDPEEIVVLHHYYPQLAAAFAKFPAADWVKIAAEVGVALQPIRSPEEALADPLLLDDGSVVELEDPELGPVRQVGVGYRLSKVPGTPGGPAPAVGQHTAEVLAEAEAPAPAAPASPGRSLTSPLAGVRVLDLGLAVAGPFGTQVLGDLGAEVIKVNTLYDMYWHANHIAFACNRGKRSIAINLKDPRGMEVLRQLVESADVVAHNMRYEAAVRLGVDEASLRAIKPDLIYCHSRGHDQARREMAGNDQTGSALAGVSYEDGGCANGGEPLWSLTSMGDTGNGFFCAIGIIQALYHRDRTGEGQFVDTSILQACLLNASSTWLAADGTAADRPHLDAELYGLSALYRLYRAAEGTWLCLAALEERHVAALFAAVAPELAGDPRFATGEARRANDGALVDELAAVFARRDAESWVKELDAAGVPAEVSSADYALTIFDDPEMVERQWVTAYDQPLVGHLEQFGLLIDFSETPGVIAGPPLTVGQDTRAILGELGRPDEEIDRLCADKVVLDPATPVAP